MKAARALAVHVDLGAVALGSAGPESGCRAGNSAGCFGQSLSNPPVFIAKHYVSKSAKKESSIRTAAYAVVQPLTKTYLRLD